MSRCFTWFPNWFVLGEPKYNINRFVLQEYGDFTWRMSDCKELVGGFSGDEQGYSLQVTPQRFCVVPEVFEVQEVPSEEVRMVPDVPNVTKVLVQKVTLQRSFDVPEVLKVQVIPSDVVRMVPE